MNFTYTSSSDYDLSTKGTKIIKSLFKMVSTSTTQTVSSLNYMANLETKLIDSGISSIRSSRGGSITITNAETPGSFPLQEQSSFLFNGGVGQVIKKDSSELRRATFGVNGIKVSASEAVAAIVVDKTKLLEIPDSTLAIEEPSGWDCSTTESVTIDLAAPDKKSEHEACEVALPTYGDCSDPDLFELGELEQQ
jgi:hypothetical protein